MLCFIKRRGVIPEDVVVHDVLRHRIGITYEAAEILPLLILSIKL
jgi:hypothetical protein